MTERILQGEVVRHFRQFLPRDAWIGAIPGGDGRMTRTPGYVPGTPDLLILWEGTAYMPELKWLKGRVSDAQVKCHLNLVDAGAKVSVCRSIGDVERFLTGHFVPLRGRIAA